MSADTVTYVHISDTHIGPTRDFVRHGSVTYAKAKSVVDAVRNIPTKIDFVVHTGDIVAAPDPNAYRLADELFSRIEVPVYFVTGNHDSALDIRATQAIGPREDLLERKDALCYAFSCKGIRFLTLDGRGPDEIDPQGFLSEDQLDVLEREIQNGIEPLVIFIHFPILPLGSRWVDREMLLQNGESLHRLLSTAKDRLVGVLFGHLHRGVQMWSDGIFYSSVASTCTQFQIWADDENARIDLAHPPAFNLVTVSGKNVIVTEYLTSDVEDVPQ